MNVYATIFSCMLYIPTYIDEEDYLSLENSLGFLGILFWIMLMTCTLKYNNTRADGHFTDAQELATDASLCFFTTLAVVVVGGTIGIAIVHYLVQPDDSSADEKRFSFLLSFYAGSIPSASCFLLLMLARTSPQTDLGNEHKSCTINCRCLSWGCMESRKIFYQIHSIYSMWTFISICSLIVFGAEFFRTSSLISGIRLVVCLISAILDVIFVFLSRFAMKHAFVLLPVIQKVCMDRADPGNRQLKHVPTLAMHDRTQFVLTKRRSGLHYHRGFKDLTGGRQDDYIQVNKQLEFPNPGDIIVKVALEDAAGKRIPVSHNHKEGKTTRRQYNVRIVSEDGTEIAKGKGVADVSNTNTANLAKFGRHRKNKVNAVYGIMRNELQEALPREVDLAGFVDVPYRRGKMYLQLDLRKTNQWEPLTLPPNDVLVTRAGFKLKPSDLRMDCPYSGDLRDQALRRVYDQPRPTLVESRCFPLKVVDEAACMRAQEEIAASQSLHEQAVLEIRAGQRVHARILQTMRCIPAPRLVEEGSPRFKKFYARTVRLTFGCYYCERPGKVIDSTRIKTWGKIVMTAARSLPAVMEGDAIGIAGNLRTIGVQFRDLLTGADGKAIKGYEELQEQLRRLEEEGGGSEGDASNYASLPPATMKELEDKLRKAGWFDEYEPDERRFMWKCKRHIGCYPRPVPLQDNP